MSRNTVIPLGHLALAADRMSNPVGVVCAANEARFADHHYSEPLTTYAVGWRDPNNLEELLEFLAPEVPAARRFEYLLADNAEEFYAETDDSDIRAIGAEFKQIKTRGDLVSAKTANKGLTIRIDRDQATGNMYEEQVTARLLRRILRIELLRAVGIISTAATNAAKTWDTTAGKDPDQDVMEMITAGAAASGVRPNRIAFGRTAWDKRSLAHRAQNTAGGFASAGHTREQLAGLLGVQGVDVFDAYYQATKTTKSLVLGNLVLGYFAESGMGLEDPSNIKRFVSEVDGGGRVRVYRQEVSSKLIDITVEHYSLIAATSSLGVRKLTLS